MTVKYKVEIKEGQKYTIDFEDFLIKEEELDQLLCDQPSKHGRYGKIAGLAKVKVETLEYRLEELEASLDLAIRSKKTEKNAERLTEGRIKAMITTEPSRLALINEIMEAKAQFEVAMAAKEASAHKKDCLISIGANRRAEYDSDLSIKRKK